MIPPGVAGPEVENAVVGVAAVSEVAEPGVAFVVGVAAGEPGVAFVVYLEVAELVFVAVDIADVSGPQASVDIAVVFVVLLPVSVVAVEVDTPGRPRLFVLPKLCSFANSSSSVEIVDKESVDSSTGVHTNYGCCSILSNVDLCLNRNLGHYYSSPSLGHNKLSVTNDLPIDATRNHSRNRCPHQYQEQRTHRSSQASLSPLEVQQIQ